MNVFKSAFRLSALPLLLLTGCEGPLGADIPDDLGVAAEQGAAKTSGLLAVIDITLSNPIGDVDNFDAEIAGNMQIYEQHGAPQLPDATLDIARIRTTPQSVNVAIDLKRRGSSSLAHPKKNYSLDLKASVPVLGMPAEKEWVMHSCYADKTCLRNLVTYWQAAKLFPWAPRTEFAEVYINNDYRGLYLIIEKVKLGPNRVNLPPPDANNPGGTFIFKRDGNDSNPDWMSAVGDNVRYFMASPKLKDLTLDWFNGLKNKMNTVEATFKPGSPTYNPAAYRDRYGQTAAIDFIISQEIGNNPDAYWKSMYQTLNRDGRVYMGPIWDLDLAYANYNPQPQFCGTNTWRLDAGGFQPISEMWHQPVFRQAFRDRYRDLRGRGVISRGAFDTLIDSMASRLALPRARDNKKWKTIGVNIPILDECYVKPTYAEEVAELKRFIRTRIEWMDAKVVEPNFVQ
jgi:hypothetical protein